MGLDAIPAYDDVDSVTIDLKWVDASRYLFLAQRDTQGWDLILREIGGPSTVLATIAGRPPAYDLAW